MNTVWMQRGEEPPIEVEAAPDALVPLMVAGYVQVQPPEGGLEEENNG